ncbi:hypothetical protein GCM10009001_20800 [Virgibacillus siamensis]|uniref:Uncharacterized protein n=2 Tax=Virgibacillus siamensis TaxID=480071 RepID=A0ABN1G3X2_9BACI
MKRAYDVVDGFGDMYVELPSEFDIHEYSMIEDFCYSLKDSQERDTLLRVIRGKGAFRRFKDTIIDFGLRQRWFDYRDECYKEIARQFCEDHGVEYVD